MRWVFIDYSKLYYSSVAKIAAPAVTKGKFVQVGNESTCYLVFSPSDFTRYHANIVERFCLDEGIEGSYDPGKKRYAIQDQAWQIMGGGKFDRNTDKKAIKFYDNSMAYGRFNENVLKEMVTALPEFSGFTVLIE